MGHRRKAEDVAEVNLPIVPMLDMAFQILAFFVATFQPHSLEGAMELNLPQEREAKADKPENVDPTALSDDSPEVDLPTELTVIMKGKPNDDNHTGEVSHYTVEGRAGASTMDSLEELQRYLEKAQQEVTNKDDIKIKADSALKYAFVVAVMDVCNKAGFKRIGFAAPPDLAD
jgi:biopolymer transport protein ExbD